MDQSQEKALLAYCLNKPGAYADQPFGPDSLVVKVAGHIFAQFGCGKDRDRITLKCSRQWGEFYRRQFPGLVTRGYHCPSVQQPYWNTLLPEEFPWEELLNLADHAYNQVIGKLTRREREAWRLSLEQEKKNAAEQDGSAAR